MSLFKRLRDLTLSNVYSLIEKAEDPVKMTDQYIRDMSNDLEDAEKAVAAQIALEKKFKKQYGAGTLVQKRNEQRIWLPRTAMWIWLAERWRRRRRRRRSATSSRLPSTATRLLLTTCASAPMQKQLVELKNKRETLSPGRTRPRHR